MAKKTTKAVARKKATDVATNDLFNQQMTGFENVGNEDISLPFLKIAQPGTPQLDELDLKSGDFFSTVSGTNFGKKVQVVALGYYRSFVKWGSELGDFQGVLSEKEYKQLEPTLSKASDKTYKEDENGFRYIDTRTFFIYLPEHPEEGILIFPLSSSGITHSKRWLTKANTIRKPDGNKAPMFATIWGLETIKNKKDPYTWYHFGDKSVTKAENLGFIKNKDDVKNVLALLPLVKDYLNNFKNINLGGAPVEEETEF
jgi:hypothetical protein